MDALRTPDERFTDLTEFPFAPHYVEVDDGDGGALRVHYLDEGEREAPAVLLMHGEPSWCFLYRKMIPVLVDAGLRAIAPDLIGFGRSDKPVAQDDYTYARHVEWMRAALFDRLDLCGLTLVGQDWGGMIGLRLVAENPDRFARVVAANTGLPTGDQRMSDAFLAWQRYSQETPVFHVGGIVKGGCVGALTPEVIAAYDAPFPDDTYKAGARRFPMLVPSSPDDPATAANRKAWEALTAWDKRQPKGVGGAHRVGQAVAHRVLRPRPGQRGRRPGAATRGARRQGSAPHRHRGSRALPAGGQGRGARPRRRRLRARHRRVSVHDSVENLARTWASIDELCAALNEDEWKRATALPGWNVQDNVSHLIDYESRALGRPAPDHTPNELGHTKNPIGRSNEVGVDYRRRWTGVQVLAEFRAVMADRLAQLRALTAADLAQPVDTPVGPGTVADMLNLRVMDTWMHEQDIRAALGRPGHVDGPAVDQALSYFTGFLPYVVGKRAGAPDGARVVVDIAGHGTVGIEVIDGRARRIDAVPQTPDVTLCMSVAGFASLVNGRASAQEVDLEIRGDEALGRAIVENLNVMV